MQSNVMERTQRMAQNIEKVCVVRVTKNYGTEAIYPANDAARTFAQIADTRTLTRTTIKLIKQLGYRVDVEAESVDL